MSGESKYTFLEVKAKLEALCAYQERCSFELEQKMMSWIQQLIGLPEDFTGVIYEGISVATIAAIAAARQAYLERTGSDTSFDNLRMYGSAEVHALIERSAFAAGILREHFRKIEVDNNQVINLQALEQQIEQDRAEGLTPFFLVAAFLS